MQTKVPETMPAADASIYLKYARESWHEDGSVEFDDNAPVNPSSDDGEVMQGVYVQSWHYVSTSEIANEMAQRLENAGIASEDLDDLVHTLAERSVPADSESAERDIDEASEKASEVNNEGLSGQCLYFITHLGAGGATAEVARLIAGKEGETAQDAPERQARQGR